MCEVCVALVRRLTGKISEDGFIERRLGLHIILGGRGDVFVSGIGEAVNIVVVFGGTPGAIRAVDDDDAVCTCPETGWAVDDVLDVFQ